MNFCVNCGRKNTEQSKFCVNCGSEFTSLEGETDKDIKEVTKNLETNFSESPKEELTIGETPELEKKFKARKYIFGILFLVALLSAGYYLKITNDKAKIKEEFMTKYDSAMQLAGTGDFEKSIQELIAIKDLDIYDDIDIIADTEMINDFLKVRTSFEEQGKETNTLLGNFKNKYNNKYKKIEDQVNSLSEDIINYDKYQEKIKILKDAISKNDVTISEQELTNIKNLTFKSSKIKEKLNVEIQSLAVEVENVKKVVEELKVKEEERRKKEEMKLKRPSISPASGLGGIVMPEYEGQLQYNLRQHESLWAPVIARRLGANDISELEIEYFDDAQAAVYYQEKGARIIKMDPYRKHLWYEHSGNGTPERLDY